jgi:alpha-ketoglutarate-dependent taurine dioxygenase
MEPLHSALPLKRRVAVKPSQNLVTITIPPDGKALPVIMSPATHGVDPFGWAAMERKEIGAILARHGAILFRGFDLPSQAEFQSFIQTVSSDPLPYVERSSPRTAVNGNIYTSTEHPPEYPIFLHCENSYQRSWPLKIFFYCHTAPAQGGETPIADTRRILARIRPEVRDAFAEKGVMYVRNFGAGAGLDWQTVFQTQDRRAVEEYCAAAGIECIWRDADKLQTRHIRKAVRKHPLTGEDVWFNHAVFFHVSTLPPDVQKMLRSVLGDDELPNNTYYGDGSEIAPEALDHLRTAYAQETVSFPWQRGDLLMLDNMLVAHGRAPFSGPRKILVGMTEPYTD